jgi:hypothetical protein
VSEFDYQRNHESLDEKIKKIRENILNQQYTRSKEKASEAASQGENEEQLQQPEEH